MVEKLGLNVTYKYIKYTLQNLDDDSSVLVAILLLLLLLLLLLIYYRDSEDYILCIYM
jgi:hypothetical protein